MSRIRRTFHDETGRAFRYRRGDPDLRVETAARTVLMFVPMLHGIGRGAKNEQSDGIVELLLACHQRIRSFTEMAIAIGERTDAPHPDIVDASARVRRYFSEALPLHVQDEEESVVPRLHGRSAELDVALDRMCEQHDEHTALLRRLIALSTATHADPRETLARTSLSIVAKQLQAAFEPHLAAEEHVIFPALRTLVSNAEQQAMVLELRTRRRPP